MRRREFIAGLGGVAAWRLAARAQQGERLRRVGVLTYGTDTEYLTLLTAKLLRDELQKLGWIEGRNLRLDFRFGFGDATQTRVFAADLVRLGPDVIVTPFLVAFRAVQRRTKTIPIVIAGAGDLLESGTTSSHPEGNATGFANAYGSLGGKWLELLKAVAPYITRVLYMSPRERDAGGYLPSVETAAQSLGVKIVAIPVIDVDGMKRAIGAFAVEPNGGLLPSPGMFAIGPDELISFAAQYRVPAVSGNPFFAANGGLMSYSADRGEVIRGAATYVDRRLRGAKVGDLPVQYPTKFRLVSISRPRRRPGLVYRRRSSRGPTR